MINWFKKKITLIIAPDKGSRAMHISISHSFLSFALVLLLAIFVTGGYFSKIYIGYRQAITENKKLMSEKHKYAERVDEILNVLQQVKKVEMRLRGMLGMKNTRNIIENYPIGGPSVGEKLSFPSELRDIFEHQVFNSNVSEVKREGWLQQQRFKDIENFIDQKKHILLSTPSIWPIFGYITSGFGWRTHPLLHRKENHKGLDIYSVYGRNTPIRATADGRVILAGWAGSFGKTVMIDHGNGFTTRYSHCSKILVKQGDNVKQAQIVSFVGSTGMSTGPHLHYEVRYRGKAMNPMRFVKGR
jgi:murein DD-endopeptidase MepM/ murein hydrolase activator NlpD